MKGPAKVAVAILTGMIAASVHAEQPMQLASLGQVQGKVLVNKGKGFVSAKSGTTLVEGDRVIALDGAQAAVVYPDGCVTALKENSLLAMEKGVACGKEPVRTGASQPLRYAAAIGDTATDAGTGGTKASPPAASTGPSAAQIAGGVLIGGAILYGISRNDDAPISGQ